MPRRLWPLPCALPHPRPHFSTCGNGRNIICACRRDICVAFGRGSCLIRVCGRYLTLKSMGSLESSGGGRRRRKGAGGGEGILIWVQISIAYGLFWPILYDINSIAHEWISIIVCTLPHHDCIVPLCAILSFPHAIASPRYKNIRCRFRRNRVGYII